MTEMVGWFAATVLLLTIARQVYTQWREGSSRSLSRWLFVGQLTASLAFVVYGWLLGNWVFLTTNALMLVTAALGQGIYLADRRRQSGADTVAVEGSLIRLHNDRKPQSQASFHYSRAAQHTATDSPAEGEGFKPSAPLEGIVAEPIEAPV